MHRFLLLLFIIGLSLLSHAAEPSSQAHQEIGHLLEYLSHSGCQFNRNGSWYGPGKAVEHLNQKYDYLRKRGLVNSAEDFIDRAASKSSISGKAYEVKCGAEAPTQSGDWLRAELARYRAGRKS